MARGSRRLRQLEREYSWRREDARRREELDAEHELEMRRVREDPLGHDRVMDAMDHYFTVLDETGWDWRDGVEAPPEVVEAGERYAEIHEKWLHGDTRSERKGPLNLSMRGEQSGQTQ